MTPPGEGIISDGETLRMPAGGQVWDVSWHSAPQAPDGTGHGSSGVCVTRAGLVVLVGNDGDSWGLPGGRPEGDESWAETLRREVSEEACARVVDARLLGFARSECVAGHERGLVLVRSFWRAGVDLCRWEPRFEIAHRRLASPDELQGDRAVTGLSDPVIQRVLVESGVLGLRDGPA